MWESTGKLQEECRILRAKQCLFGLMGWDRVQLQNLDEQPPYRSKDPVSTALPTTKRNEFPNIPPLSLSLLLSLPRKPAEVVQHRSAFLGLTAGRK
jgi:hypothetical protein